jgi:hypothetical protein
VPDDTFTGKRLHAVRLIADGMGGPAHLADAARLLDKVLDLAVEPYSSVAVGSLVLASLVVGVTAEVIAGIVIGVRL